MKYSIEFPVRIEGFPPKLYVRCFGGWRRVHHFWLGLIYALTDIQDYRVWVSDFRKFRDEAIQPENYQLGLSREPVEHKTDGWVRELALRRRTTTKPL